MITNIVQIIIILSGVWLIFISTYMFINPNLISHYFKKAGSTNFINYTEITLRCIWGVSLLLYSEFSKYPEYFNIFGYMITSTSVILFLIPRKWHARYAVWAVSKIEPYMRFAAPFSFTFGIFLIYAIL